MSAQGPLRSPTGRQEALPALPNQNNENAAMTEKDRELFMLSPGQVTTRVLKNAVVRIFEPDSFVRKDAEDRTTRALIGPNWVAEDAASGGYGRKGASIGFYHPARPLRRSSTAIHEWRPARSLLDHEGNDIATEVL